MLNTNKHAYEMNTVVYCGGENVILNKER